MINSVLILYFFVLISFPLFGANVESWANEISSRVDQDAVEWLRSQMKEQIPNINEKQNYQTIKEKRCNGNLFISAEESNVYVFASFSMPDQIWIELSAELNKIGGVFVIRGLPNNSFSELSKRVLRLKEKGIEASIRIEPALFDKFQIDKVPTIVVVDDKTYDKVSGSVSIDFALKKIENEGESFLSKKQIKREKNNGDF